MAKQCPHNYAENAMLQPTHGVGGLGTHHPSDHQPVEESAETSEVLIDGRLPAMRQAALCRAGYD